MANELMTRLADAEQRIEAGANQARSAFIEIRDHSLYREKYASFADYCERRWNMSRARGYQLLKAAEVIEEIRKTGDEKCQAMLDTLSDRAAEALSQAPEGTRAESLKQAAESAPKDKRGNSRVSAKHVEKVVAKRKEPADTAPSAEPKLDPEPWTEHNADAQRMVGLMDEYMEIVKRMAATPFGGWVDVKAHNGVAKATKTNFEKWQVVGFKPQWEIGPDGRNFYYAHEKRKGSK